MERLEADDDICWALRIEGKLETYGRHGRLANRKFSHYFQSVLVEIERGASGDGSRELIEWRNGPNVPESDGFEIRRRGVPANNQAKIVLCLANQPERFRLSPQLASVLQLEAGSRPEVILAVWQYIKLHKLQESDEKKTVLNDDAFRSVFGVDRMTFSEIPDIVAPHLLPIEPVVIEYELDLVHGGGLLVEDVEVELEDPSKSSRPSASVSVANLQREIGTIDQKISECISAIKISLASTKLLDAFSNDPIRATNQILAKQLEDYETVVGDVTISPEDLNKAALYEGEEIEQAVQLMLQSVKL